MSHSLLCRLFALGLMAASGLVASGCGRSNKPLIRANMDDALALRAEFEKGQAAAGAGGGPAAAVPTGFGWLTGAVRLSGEAPQRTQLSPDKDVEVCAKKPIFDESVVANGDRLANVLIYLETKIPADDPQWEHPSFAAARTAELRGAAGFDQKDCLFLSHVFAMRSTQTVEVLNSDPIGHNTNLASTRGAQPKNESVPAGGSFLYAPGGESPAPFPVTCSIHPWMKAWMITRHNPYFAVSKPDGTFEIPLVPAGVELEFRIWQEKAGFLNADAVTMTFEGQSIVPAKGKFKLTVPAAAAGTEAEHKTPLEVVVNAAALQ